jgi:tetratricopeptide (TPR) repeat protein
MLKKLWQTLVRLWNRIFKPTPPPPPPVPKPRPTRSDADYEAIFIKILDGVNNGWSRGNIKAIFTSENVREEELQGWLCRFAATEFVVNVISGISGNDPASVESLREMAGRMVQFGQIYGGKLGEEAVQLGEQILGVRQPESEEASKSLPNQDINCHFVREASPQAKRNAVQRKISNEEANEEADEEAKAWFQRGVEQYEKGDFEGALASWNRAVEINPAYHEAWNNRGIALANLGRYEEAIASYDKALEIKPALHEAWNNRGSALDDLGRYEEAIADYDKALEIKPALHEAWNNRGVALRNLGRYEEAIASYDKALEIKPDFHEAWYNRGNALDDLGRYEEAIASYDKALEIKPDKDEAWYNRGNALDDLGRTEEAIASYDKAIEIKPDKDEAWYGRGNALRHLGRTEEAIASYDKAVEIKPAYHEAWNNRGLALDDLGRYEEAIASYDKAVEIKPDFHEAWYNRGIALKNLGRYEEAIASYDKALEIKPAYHEAWINRGIAAGSLTSRSPLSPFPPFGNSELNEPGYKGKLASYQEGLKHCQKDTHPEGWGILHWQIGDAHYYQGKVDKPKRFARWQEARDSYDKALETLTASNYPEWHLQVLKSLIRLLLKQRNTGSAQEISRKATDVFQKLIQNTPSLGKQKQLQLKFAEFNQLTVNIWVQQGEKTEALAVAEAGKNTCLRWLLSPDAGESPSPTYDQIQQFLTHLPPLPRGARGDQTALIYWHQSPVALTTFILTPSLAEPIVLSDPDFERLEKFEKWMKEWNEHYNDYRQKKDASTEKERHPWRKQMSAKLEELAEILEIPTILEAIADCSQLILCPHQDLHLLPLEALLPEDFLMFRLPSIQVGRQLEISAPTATQTLANLTSRKLLSVEVPSREGFEDLPFAEVESAVISDLFAATRIQGDNANVRHLQTIFKQSYWGFHFTGHGVTNIQNPLNSYLALAGTEDFKVEHLLAETLNQYLLVSLSSCETGISKNYDITTEFVGFNSALMRAGVRCVVSSLWTVQSDSSGLFMMQFYRQLKKGKSAVQAFHFSQYWLKRLTPKKLCRLYQTILKHLPLDETPVRPNLERECRKLAKMNQDQTLFAHPYYWSAFILAGNFQ